MNRVCRCAEFCGCGEADVAGWRVAFEKVCAVCSVAQFGNCPLVWLAPALKESLSHWVLKNALPAPSCFARKAAFRHN